VSYLAPLAILAIVMGIFPDAFLSKTRPSIKYLAENFRKYELTVAEPHLPVNTATAQPADEGGSQ
jgi:NADH:ubiquinone oxidoreductase subunit 4 (subunit M)